MGERGAGSSRSRQCVASRSTRRHCWSSAISCSSTLDTRTSVRYRRLMDYELENLRRSIAMLSPGARALDREQALRVLADLQAAQRERDELRERLAERDGPFE